MDVRFGKMIFWVLCRQDLRPERWNGHFFFGQRSEVELVFLDLLCSLNAPERHGRRLESLESEHRPDALFDPAMILLDDVVQVLGGANPYPAR